MRCTFAVDFVGQSENFVPDDLRGTPDAPFVRDVAEHSRTDHRDIVLNSDELADPDVRSAVIRARDIPAGLGDMDASLYLLFRAARSAWHGLLLPVLALAAGAGLLAAGIGVGPVAGGVAGELMIVAGVSAISYAACAAAIAWPGPDRGRKHMT